MKSLLSELSEYELVHSSQDVRGWDVRDPQGHSLGRISDLVVDTDRERVTSARLTDGKEIAASRFAIRDGYVEVRGDATVAVGVTAPDRAVGATAQGIESGAARGDGRVVVPVVEEEISVTKRTAAREGVRVATHVVEQPVAQQVELTTEHVTVERHAVDRPIAAEAFAKDRTVEVRATAEEPVVRKEARIVGEVVVTKTATDRKEVVRDRVRRTDVQVQPVSERGVASSRR